jgi:two-component system, NarL family, nitrate/nitrite response regulator NarL
MHCLRAVIADHHPVMLQGLSNLLGTERDFRVVARCVDGAACIEAIRSLAPDIAILDIAMPDISREEILGIANSKSLATRLVFFTTFVEDRDLMMLAEAGACDVISKDAEPGDLVQTLRQIAEGSRNQAPPSSNEAVCRAQSAIADKTLMTLTERERQIMRLVSEGLSNKEIGRRLNISDGTIKVHLHHVFQKLEISNRTVLAALALSASL